ncbi:GntR family transcriptional regulator [Romboutsia lituseburensis]|uniref:DNA-binding transcriptional regulator, GntR family n=1 Tax=Romboutsia lituseburensis DSM 797 TaxID=1121325 RepID=A0A1G9SY92_9FIRM|nr:GntR family transcriptional regulator [Romboutsia lituseburensis]CEH35964.1 FCD domain protein [Romboutsia lituseburensis]SDM40277.1 DNA-binding transcriptional regulator, GntR family [Romboutsia lituseburensis DSM 797]
MDNLTKLNLDDYKPLRDVVFENLREAILEGKLKPGQRLMEVQLAEQLGVSRTPVREAIRKLELEGLVIMLPRKGAYVANMSLKDILDVLEIRASLEGLAASLAAERISEDDLKRLELIAKDFEKSADSADVEELLRKDVEFHECIFKATNNKKLHQLINSLWEQVYRFRVTYISDYDSSVSIICEHKSILDAIKKGDTEMAKKYATEHIEKAEQFMIEKAMNNKNI